MNWNLDNKLEYLFHLTFKIFHIRCWFVNGCVGNPFHRLSQTGLDLAFSKCMRIYTRGKCTKSTCYQACLMEECSQKQITSHLVLL